MVCQAWFLYAAPILSRQTAFSERYLALRTVRGMVLPGHWAMGHREEHHDARARNWRHNSAQGGSALVCRIARPFAAAGRQRLLYGEWQYATLDLGDDQKSLELLKNAAGICRSRVGAWLPSYDRKYRKRISTQGRLLTGDRLLSQRCRCAQEIKDPVSVRKWSYNIRLSYSLLCQSIEQMRTTTA